MLTDYLSKDKILLNIEAQDYKATINKMLAASERKNHSDIIETIMKRELLMPTALGNGIALPRTILDDGIKTEIIIAISQKGISLNSLDRRPVKIIFLCLFQKNEDYSSILAQSLHLLNDDSLKTELLKAKTKDEVFDIIKTWEAE